uniref:Uncharacterized protein n=1 Tax=Romanomermis culicivorax TaxID=13658 RepID=A0A915J7J6_ROMCU
MFDKFRFVRECSHLSRQLSAGESVDGKISTAKDVGPTVSQMKNSSWIDRPKNDNPVAGKKSRRKLLGCAVAVLIVNLVVVAYVLTFFLWSPDNSPLAGIIRGNVIPNMTELCRQKYGVCAYFPSKFVRNCIEEICSTVMLEAFMKRKVPQGFRLGLKKHGTAMTIRIPDDTPCIFNQENKIGMCYQGLCYYDSKDVDLLSNYSNVSVVNGGWKLVEPSVDNCLNESSRARSCSPIPPNCPVVSYVRFRSCTAPIPSTGGTPCWKEGLYTESGLDLTMKNNLGFELWRNLPLTLNNCTIDSSAERSKSCAINAVLSNKTVSSSIPACPAKHCGTDLTFCQSKHENHCLCVWGFCSDLNVNELIIHNTKA